MHNLS